MGEGIANVVKKLNTKKSYKSLFRDAFGDSLITGTRILKSLAQFQLTLVSDNLKYDKVKQGESALQPKSLTVINYFKKKL